MAPNKADKIKSLFKLVQKRHKYAPSTVKRSVLEHLMYAAVLEDAPLETADSAFAVLEHHYIDWNEIRVSTPQELADTLPMLPNPLTAGERIKKTLQAVFETYYMFDLEDLHKKTIAQATEYLRSITSCSRFMADYTILFGLGGHVIPIDELAMRIFRLLGLAQVSKDGTREEVLGIERSVAKNQGPEWSMLLHLFAVNVAETGDCEALRELLKGIDPAVAKRDCIPPVLVPPPKAVRPVTERTAPPLRELKPQLFEDDPDVEILDEIAEPDAEIDFTPAPLPGTAGYESAPFETDGDEKPRPSKSKSASKPAKARADSKGDAATDKSKSDTTKPAVKRSDKSATPKKADDSSKTAKSAAKAAVQGASPAIQGEKAKTGKKASPQTTGIKESKKPAGQSGKAAVKTAGKTSEEKSKRKHGKPDTKKKPK